MQTYGGFWVRVLAYIIDAIILQMVSTILIMMVAGVGFATGGANEESLGFAVFGAYGLTLVINWLYYAVLESSTWQGTVGKKALNLVVTDDSGGRIGFGRATGRYFAKIISSLILLFGFFMIGWTQRKQGLHDMIAGTLVHKTNSPDHVRSSAAVFE